MGFKATLRRTRRPLACVPLICTLAAVPAAALARAPRGGSGGIGVAGGSGGSAQTSFGSSSTAPATRPIPGVISLGGVLSASGDGISFTIAATGTLGQPLTISGSAPSGDAGSQITIESARPGHGSWTRVAAAQIASNGTFSAQWIPSASARTALRAVLAPAITPAGTTDSSGSTGLTGGSSASTASSEPTTSPLTIPIFRDAVATLYGPGFWGHHTACGQTLRRNTIGVASRTLRCGTRVAVFYNGHELTVPVIDRGPFGGHASWDLTMATARALGIRQTVTIGTLSGGAAAAIVARG